MRGSRTCSVRRQRLDLGPVDHLPRGAHAADHGAAVHQAAELHAEDAVAHAAAAELRKKYKNDKQRLNEETMKFYKENGINPLGGCLPLVAQLPVFWSLFNVLKAIADWTPGHDPAYGMTVPFVESAQQARIFGISLYDQFLHPAAGESSTSRLLIVVFVLVSAATTFLTMRQSQKRGMMNQTPPDPDQPGAAAAQAMSKNMMYIAPFFALTGLYWQFGLVIYWVTTNVWTLGQQHFLFRSLPVVGSATVGASATQAASGNSGTARSASGAAAKTGTASAKTGAAAKTGTGVARQVRRQDRWHDCARRATARQDGNQAGGGHHGRRAATRARRARTARPSSAAGRRPPRRRRAARRRTRTARRRPTVRPRTAPGCCGGSARRRSHRMFRSLRRPRSSGSSRSGRHAVSAATRARGERLWGMVPVRGSARW